MKYTELNIETQRQAPARARSEGDAMLRRAGYFRPDGEATTLGKLLGARVDELTQQHEPAALFDLLSIPVITTEDTAFYFALSAGKSEVLRCESCGYAARRELARFRKEPFSAEPAAALERVLTPDCHTIEALARFLGVATQKTAKALMYTRTTDQTFVFVVVRGDMQLSEAKLERQLGPVRAATGEEIAAAGAAAGYASPIGLCDGMIVVDDLIARSPNLVAGANEPGYHLLNTNYPRDYRAQVEADLVMAEPGAPCPNCGHALSMLRAGLLHDEGGYHAENIMEALAETHHDEKGLTLPAVVAPFEIYLMHLPSKNADTRRPATELYERWQQAGARMLFDDRDERAGVKFADADLIGCPMRATVGERGLKDGMVELKSRTGTESVSAPLAEALDIIRKLNKAP